MAKTPLQIQAYLSHNRYITPADWEMIKAFCADKCEYNGNAEICPKTGVSASEFLNWYQFGFGAGDVVECDGKLAMVGLTRRNTSKIVANFQDNTIIETDIEAPSGRLKITSEEDYFDFMDAMFRQGLQFGWNSYRLIKRWVPDVNDRIIFHREELTGLGVVRSVDRATGDVELYCYHIYNTGKTGYSMHEKNICNLKDYWFEPMDNGDKRQSKMNGISCQRRLNRELNKFGKTWNERLHRVEPMEMQVSIGEKYWYITDRMVVKSEIEKGLQLTRDRANAGNYFRSIEDAMDVQGQIVEIIRERLAK